jgi:cytoskeletal protein CcmA (bactofilin family)
MIFKRDEETEASEVPVIDPPSTGRRHTGEEREMAEQGEEVTIVGAGARLEGNVVSAGSLRIDGQVKGQINAEGDVALSPQSQVEADIRAQNVSVAGAFKGNIIVKGKAHLARGGRVDGNITSKTLVIEEGGIFHGQSIMDGGASGSGSGSGSTSSGQAGASQGAPAATQTEKGTDQVKVP